MGSLFFAILMLLLFAIATILFILGIVKLVNHNKNIGLILIGVAFIFAILPTCWLCVIRAHNLSMTNHCETNIFIKGGYQSSHFSIDNKEYSVFDVGSPGSLELGPAVASWSAEQTLLDKLFGYKNCGNYYVVTNENGYDLLTDGSSRLFCSEDDFQYAKNWYNDCAIYQWYFKPLYGAENQKVEITNLDLSMIAKLSSLDESYDKDANSIIPIKVSKNNALSSYCIFAQSRDGVIECKNFFFKYYQSEFFICNAQLDEKDSITYYLQPMPNEINLFLNSYLPE